MTVQCSVGSYFTRTSGNINLSDDQRSAMLKCLIQCVNAPTCTHAYFGSIDGNCMTVTDISIQTARGTDVIYKKVSIV